MSTPRWLARAARACPGHAALRTPDGVTSYAELEREALALAARLVARGVEPGSRVAVVPDDARALVVLLHAAMAARATLVPLAPRLGAAELAPLLADTRPALIVAADSRHRALASAGAAAECVDPAALAHGRPSAGFEPAGKLEAAADHAILFTSGTSGRPRGVRLSHANQLASARASARRLGHPPHERWLLCMPAHHIGGLAIPLRCAIAGTTVVLHDGFDAGRVGRALERGEASLVSLVPTMLQRVLESGALRARPPRLRAILLGGGPLPETLRETCVERGLPLAPTYGLTEAASQLATLLPDELRRAPGSAGRALPGTELRVVRPDGVEAGPGEAGEILARGPQVMRGYLDPAASARALAGGWLHTGDIGTLDAEGYLRVLERREDLIVSGGENVYPAEVEAALAAHPDVREAAVIGLPDELWGQRVHAVVAADPAVHLDLERLDAWLRERLAGFKRPRGYTRLDVLPRTASGKLQRAQLREQLTSRPPAGPTSRASERDR